MACLLLAAAAAWGEDLFVPMVAQKSGQDGTWWNTEVWISNTSTSSGGYASVFLPAGQANLEGLQVEPPLEDLPPGVTVYRSDLVPEGAVGVLRLVTTPGIVAVARVFNAAGRGSFGQGISAVSRSAATRPGEIAHLVGLRRTPQFRTNVALFNPGQDGGVVRIRVLNARGEVIGEQPYRLAPGGSLQIDDFLHAFQVSRGEHLRAEVSGTVAFLAFASVVDSRSGAPTLVSPLR